MNKKLVSFGCSFTRHSHNDENLHRRNRTIKEKRGLLDAAPINYLEIPPNETSYTIEAAIKLKTLHENHAVGGSGVRAVIYKMLYYVKNNPTDDVFITIGISDFSRFDFIKPFWGKKHYPRLPQEDYAKYFDYRDAEFELLSLIEMAGLYLTKNNVSHLFINTLNGEFSIKDKVNTLIFPNNSEYWIDYIQSYDDTYFSEHPNFNDHVILGKLLANKLES